MRPRTRNHRKRAHIPNARPFGLLTPHPGLSPFREEGEEIVSLFLPPFGEKHIASVLLRLREKSCDSLSEWSRLTWTDCQRLALPDSRGSDGGQLPRRQGNCKFRLCGRLSKNGLLWWMPLDAGNRF